MYYFKRCFKAGSCDTTTTIDTATTEENANQSENIVEPWLHFDIKLCVVVLLAIIIIVIIEADWCNYFQLPVLLLFAVDS